MDYGGHFRFRRHNRALQHPSPGDGAGARRRTAARRVPARVYLIIIFFFWHYYFRYKFPLYFRWQRQDVMYVMQLAGASRNSISMMRDEFGYVFFSLYFNSFFLI